MLGSPMTVARYTVLPSRKQKKEKDGTNVRQRRRRRRRRKRGRTTKQRQTPTVVVLGGMGQAAVDAKGEVDPGVQLVAHHLALQRLAVLHDKVRGVWARKTRMKT